MRIAILGINYRPEMSGIAPYTASLAEGLAARGHDVRVVTSPPHYPEWKTHDGYGHWAHVQLERGVEVVRLRHILPVPPTGVARLLSELSFGFRLMFAHWGKPDAVILVSPALFSCAIALLRSKLSPRSPVTVMWVQDVYGLGMAETGSSKQTVADIMTKIEARILKSAGAVAVIHDRFKRQLVERMGVPEAAVHVIRNWSHLPPTPQIDRAAVRQEMDWPESTTVVLHAGNMGVKQGLENVIHAARLAHEQHEDVLFVLMGHGSQRDSLAKMAGSLPTIRLIEAQSDDMFQHVMGSADILLVNELPGIAEMAVPSKLTSYYSTGLPVIAATDATSVTAGEVMAAGAGLRVDAGQAQLLLDGVLSLTLDPDAARRMGQSAREFRRAHLDQEAGVAKFELWIDGLVAARTTALARSMARNGQMPQVAEVLPDARDGASASL